ncbi:response regulator [Paenibacillus hamazuiensis]|uniref:response regulator n=1 Tax=Paenibacillus hamazuiensis TaxID=2936508 RepID=UPI002010C285|nr:helix-turn-helix domain-containing protein [Paenibacillus hamazuiensis]
MNIMIVDDESIIRNGLARAIGEFAGFRVVGTADDGESALEWLKTASILPDLIITDIFMQYIDGLDFIEQVSVMYPDIKFVILSGHGEFHLAQKAIHLKVCRYITKPAETGELYSVLSGMKEELDKNRSKQLDLLRREQLAANAALYIRDKLLSDLLEGRLISREELSDFAGCFPFSLNDPILGGVIRLLKIGQDLTQRDVLLYGVAVKQLFSEAVLSQMKGFAMMKEIDTLIFGILPENFENALGVVMRFPDLSENVLGVPVALELGEEAGGLLHLKSSVAAALRRMEERISRRIRSEPEERAQEIASYSGKPHSALVDKVIKHMNDHYGNRSLSLQQLAAQAEVHPNYLTQAFRRHTGLSCMQFLARLRMERAKELLHGTDLKICEIAERVGYDNPLYFSTYFKKWVGKNPSAYKEDGLSHDA